MKNRIFLVISALFLLSSTSRPLYAEEKKIITMGSFQALGAFSGIDKGSDLWGYSFSGSLSPAIKLNSKQYLIPLYSGNYERMRQYITQEEGGRFYNTTQLHNLSTSLRTQHSDEFVSRLTGIATWSLVKETQDEEFGKGLYDYRDFGAALDLRQTLKINDTTQHVYAWGIEYFRRTYPNFKSLISLAAGTAPDTAEKDFDGIKLSFGVEEKLARGISWEFKPSLLLKYFIDKKTIGDDGVLKSGKRRDQLVSSDLNGYWPFAEGRWVLSDDNTMTYNHSNLDFYDSRGTLILSDDVFTKGYYSYFSYRTYPYLTYYHPIGKDKKFALRGGYSFLLRHYPGRKAQESNGAYTDSKQRDIEHGLHVSSSYPISKEMSWVNYFDYTWARSNQKYEAFYRYTFNVFQVQTGISIEF